ncbi:MAG: type II toxin-antitoxin system PemK/MazF family toxin [Sphingobacteriaceae bacterium]|nr:MAG: type II toxin-antitoxin system PemK/MazF family toxin [Sphingobacteriaceae bacterium]
MIYKQGDIVLLPFPFTDQQGTKVRPGIVVSNSLVNSTSTDVIIAQLTTQNLSSNVLAIELSNNHVAISFKPPHNTQFVYCKKVLVIDSNLIIKRISAVADQAKMEQILKKIQSVFDIEL